MYRDFCPTCNGSHIRHVLDEASRKWLPCDNPNCDEGLAPLEEDKKVYVNVYKVTREFGGHEEGGWWYNWLECLETVPCKNKYSDEIAEDLEKEYEGMKHGNIYSVLGGADIAVYIEEKRCESETKQAPIYE